MYAESRGFEPPPTSQPMSRFSKPGGHPLVHTFQSGERWIRTTVPLAGGHRFSKPDAPSYTRTLQRWTTSQRLSTPVSPLREHGPPSGGNGSRTRERRLMRPMRDRRAVPLCVRLRWEARTYTLPRACPGIEPGPGTPHYHHPGLIPYGVSVFHSSIELTRARNHPCFTSSPASYFL